MQQDVTLDEVLDLVKQLPLRDKIRLIERVAPQIEQEIDTEHEPRISLRGLWGGTDITDEDIAKARREMWGNFPRGDI